MTTASDARLAWIAVAIALRLTSVRGLTLANIPGQLGITATTLSHAVAKFARLANLDHASDVRFSPE